MNNAEILIIDDEVQIRRLLEITLESNNYHCVICILQKKV